VSNLHLTPNLLRAIDREESTSGDLLGVVMAHLSDLGPRCRLAELLELPAARPKRESSSKKTAPCGLATIHSLRLPMRALTRSTTRR